MFFFLIILLLLRDSFLIILLLLIDVWYHLVGLNLVSLRQLAYSQHLICSSSHLTMISQNICMIVSTLQLIYPSIWKNRKHRIEMPTKVRNKVGMCKLALGDPEICSVSNKWRPPLFYKHMKAPSMQLFFIWDYESYYINIVLEYSNAWFSHNSKMFIPFQRIPSWFRALQTILETVCKTLASGILAVLWKFGANLIKCVAILAARNIVQEKTKANGN